MIDVLMTLAAVALPLALGLSLVRFLERPRADDGLGVLANWPSLIGVGYLVGLLGTTLLLRALSAVGISWNFGIVAALALVLTAANVALSPALRNLRAWRTAPHEISPTNIVVTVLLALVALRFAMLLAEVWWRPLYPWDAWAQWATKAAAWYDLRGLAPFVWPHEWLADRSAQLFSDQAPHYPSTVPLVQVWHALALGRFDESLMNIPWVTTGLALVLAFYGQARALGYRPLPAAIATYALASLPFLNTHVALAGYADVFIAAVYGVAMMLFMRWVESLPADHSSAVGRWFRGGQTRLLVLSVMLLLMLPFIKRPGFFWAISIAAPLTVLLLPRVGSWILLVATLLLVGSLLIMSQVGIKIFNYQLVSDTDFGDVSVGLLQNFFAMANWHLFWYLFIATLALCLKKLWWPRNDAHTALVAYGLVFLASVFYFSMAGEWVSDFSTVNRAVIHLVPLVAFYMLVMLRHAFPMWVVRPVPRHARRMAQPKDQEGEPPTRPTEDAIGIPAFAPVRPRPETSTTP